MKPIVNLPTDLTPAQETKLAADKLAENLVKNNLIMLTQAHNLIWRNPKLKPAEACAAFGTDGANMFAAFSAVKQVLEDLTGKSLDLPIPKGFDGVIANNDGSLSVVVSPQA